MAKKVNSTKDRWDKLDVIFKAFAGILISGAIAFYGIKSTTKQTEIAESNRRAQILVQTMNHRETSASQMRAQMFKTLMEHYFKEKDDENTQIIILELIGLNFQDHIHLKPLFKGLDTKLTKNSSERNIALMNVRLNLRRIKITNVKFATNSTRIRESVEVVELGIIARLNVKKKIGKKFINIHAVERRK